MKKSPAVSVALATYNGAGNLLEQLASLQAQTLHPAELVVSDDGSSDDTIAIIEQFQRTSPFPVHLLRQEQRLGYRRNFRRAAQHCCGELIAFCDQDDVWHPQKLERMAAAFRDERVLLAYHNANVVDAEGKRLRLKLDSATERAELSRSFLGWKSSYGLLQVFRAGLRQFDHLWDLSIDHNDRSEILAHDQWYFFLAGMLGTITFVDEPLVDYRQHGANLYGAPKARGWLGRLRDRFVHFGGPDAELAQVALARARICEALLATGASPAEPVRLHQNAYETLAKRLQRRSASYAHPHITGRFASLLSAMVKGDYRGKPWGFEPASMVRDLWSGVIRQQVDDPAVTLPPLRQPDATALARSAVPSASPDDSV